MTWSFSWRKKKTYRYRSLPLQEPSLRLVNTLMPGSARNLEGNIKTAEMRAAKQIVEINFSHHSASGGTRGTGGGGASNTGSRTCSRALSCTLHSALVSGGGVSRVWEFWCWGVGGGQVQWVQTLFFSHSHPWKFQKAAAASWCLWFSDKLPPFTKSTMFDS